MAQGDLHGRLTSTAPTYIELADGTKVQLVVLGSSDGSERGTLTAPIRTEHVNATDRVDVEKFGLNASVDGSFESIWTPGGLYPWATFATAQSVTLSSTNAADTSITVSITGHDATGAEQTVTATTNASNGTTAVAVSGTWTALFLMRVTAGTTTQPAGDLQAKVGATVVGQITTPYNRSQMAIYEVPTGFTAYVPRASYQIGKTANDVDIGLWVQPAGETVFQLQDAVVGGTAGTIPRIFGDPGIRATGLGPYAAGTRIEIRAKASTGSVGCSGEFYVEQLAI